MSVRESSSPDFSDSETALQRNSNVSPSIGTHAGIHEGSDDEAASDDEFVYPANSSPHLGGFQSDLRQTQPSTAQLESSYAAASSGDLAFLKRLFKNALDNGDVQPFSLANDATSRTGSTALHVASSRGHQDIVAWLIEDCGALADLEDREGETALHKAALNGHISIVKYLVSAEADVLARDSDGWTALHNACSKGYLDIVRYLCEKGGSTLLADGTRAVDIKSKDGWTPLMNAASKGHLPVVLYLLTKEGANPLTRNKWGETAYDVAAAVFEVWICEILQQVESERWRTTTTPYNPLLVHTTLPLVLYENQRLDARLKTVAVAGKPRFSSSGLGKQGRLPPFELKLPMVDSETGLKTVPASRSNVQLPLQEAPWVLPRPSGSQQPTVDNLERSHFWLSDWTLDVTHPTVDVEGGWQYARSFDEPDDKWTAEMPLQLERVISHGGIVSTSFGGPSFRGNQSSSSSRPAAWVRRRRWVRIMRRRLDMPPLPFLEPDGSMYHLDFDGSLLPYVESRLSSPQDDSTEGQELGAMSTPFLSSAQDYVSRARYHVGKQQDHDINDIAVSSQDARRTIAKLERATMELRQGLLQDDDVERKIQAEVLLNAYSRDLERRRLAAGAQGLLTLDHDGVSDDDDDDDDEFHYPHYQETSQPVASSSSSVSASDYFSRTSASRVPADLTPHLTQAPDFRVPTQEAPRKIRIASPTSHQLHGQWERDDTVSQCRDCQRRFTFLNRRHHCRKCGRIFCDRCSSYRTILEPAEIITDPLVLEMPQPGTTQRVCQTCFEETTNNLPHRLNSRNSIERIVVDQERLTIPGALTRRQSSSQLSDLADCPVCNRNLDEVGDAQAQEIHVKSCLDGGLGTPQTAKYLVYRLPAESALLGAECVICLEEFVKGSTVARLSCFCSFHSVCLSSWLQRGKSCPVHAR